MEMAKEFKPNEEQPASAGRNSPILNASYSCLELVFDYLSLPDHVAVGMTCKDLQQFAGKYFCQYYPSEAVTLRCDDDGCVEETVLFDRFYTNFGRFTNRVCIEGDKCDDDDDPQNTPYITEIFRNMSMIQNKKIKSIEFTHVRNISRDRSSWCKIG